MLDLLVANDAMIIRLAQVRPRAELTVILCCSCFAFARLQVVQRLQLHSDLLAVRLAFSFK